MIQYTETPFILHLQIIFPKQSCDVCIRAETKVAKQHSKVHTCFYQCCSYLHWLQNAYKTGLLSCSCCCFYLVLASLDRKMMQQLQHSLNFSGMHQTLLATCTSPHVHANMYVQTLKWVWQQSFEGEIQLQISSRQMKVGTFEPFTQYYNTPTRVISELCIIIEPEGCRAKGKPIMNLLQHKQACYNEYNIIKGKSTVALCSFS